MMGPTSRTATRAARLLLAAAIAIAGCSPGATTTDDYVPPAGGAPGRPNVGGIDDLYVDLPDVVVINGAATVGRDGGHLEFADGFVLDIPAGALTEPLEIRGHTTAVPSAMAGLGAPQQPAIELLPSGTRFAKPVRLRIGAPSEGSDSVFMVAAEPDDPILEDIGIASAGGQQLAATLWHFTVFGLFFRATSSEPAVEDVAATSGCSTAPVRGLSLQIAGIFRELVGDELVPVTNIATSDPLGPPLMQPLVAEEFIAALSDQDAITPWRLQVTSGWRSVAQQYVLANCGLPNAVAAPGTSNHADGTAVDLVGAWGSAAACRAASCVFDNQKQVYDCGNDLLDRAHPVWGHILEKPTYGFKWYGTEKSGDKACGDPPHFDAKKAGLKDLKAASVRAFQVLWNRNHPCLPVAESGVFDFDTETLLASSPAGGFPATTAVQLPPEGLGSPKLDDCEGGKLCCPVDALHSKPYCALKCGCNEDTCPKGCCDATGKCFVSEVDTACGTGGDSCDNCTLLDTGPLCAGGAEESKIHHCNAAACDEVVKTTACPADPAPSCAGSAAVSTTHYQCPGTGTSCVADTKTVACPSGATCQDGTCQCPTGTSELTCGSSTSCQPTGSSCCNAQICSPQSQCFTCNGTSACKPLPFPLCCPGDQVDCNGTCRDVNNDPNNCGACGKQCPDSSPKCSAKTCGACDANTCADGTCCGADGECKNPLQLQTDPSNCGSCGNACGYNHTPPIPSNARQCFASTCYTDQWWDKQPLSAVPAGTIVSVTLDGVTYPDGDMHCCHDQSLANAVDGQPAAQYGALPVTVGTHTVAFTVKSIGVGASSVSFWFGPTYYDGGYEYYQRYKMVNDSGAVITSLTFSVPGTQQFTAIVGK